MVDTAPLVSEVLNVSEYACDAMVSALDALDQGAAKICGRAADGCTLASANWKPASEIMVLMRVS
jgi:hypothetical protein